MGVLQRLTGPFREFGLGAGLLYSFDRVLRKLSPSLGLYVYEFMVQPIPEDDLLPARRLKKYSAREIKKGAPEIELMPARPDIKESRFEQGAVCLGLYNATDLVGFIWFCRERYEEDEARCTYVLPDGDPGVFDFDVYVFPKYRMGTAFVALWNVANTFLREQGVKYSYSRLTRFNLASRASHKHMGWQRLGRAVFFRMWRLEFMVATIAPYVSVTCSSRVNLKFRADVLSKT